MPQYTSAGIKVKYICTYIERTCAGVILAPD